MTQYFGVLKIQPGKRTEYIKSLTENSLVEKFRNQPGNIYYYISESITEADVVTIIDAWDSRATFEAHCNSPEVKGIWNDLINRYVEKELTSAIYEIG